ncbi:MAG: PEP-CTERM sorting domain-containing protein, partial [Pirellulales bacterium]
TNPNNEFGNEYPEVDGFSTGGINGTGALHQMAGLTFDTDFEADYYLTYSNGEETASNGEKSWAITPHFTKIDKLVSAGGTVPDPPAGEATGALGGTTDAQGIDQNLGGALEDAANNNGDLFDVFWSDRATANTIDLRFAIDNSNTEGVGGVGGQPADQEAAAAVPTGAELSIPLDVIGSPETGRIRMSLFINGTGHDFVSNQVIGGLPETFGNLAGPASVDFSQNEGDQFVTMRVIGDMDTNGRVDFDDIDPFVLGLNDAAQYTSDFGISPIAHGDTDRNGRFDFDDIPGFVDLLGGGELANAAQSVPEPGAMVLLITAVAAGLVGFRRR